MPEFDQSIQPQITEALGRFESLLPVVLTSPMASLGDGPESPELRQWIRTHRSSLPPLVECGLWLLCGDLNASHEISQSIETADGSFWHGIMHRREGDFWNAKYWFRRVGRHPVLQALADTDYGDPAKFVDRCEAARKSSGDAADCQRLQWLEWQHLMLHDLTC